MRYSRNFPFWKHYFREQRLLSERQAILFVLEEALLLLLIVIQIYRFLGIAYVDGALVFFQTPIQFQNILWFFATIIFFVIGYIIIAIRDRNVWLIHHNFQRLVFGTLKLKIQFANKRTSIFLVVEFIYSIFVALCILIYLDPDVNVLPQGTPKIYNYLGFLILIGIGLIIFSRTKDFRHMVYGPTPFQKRLHLGRFETKRITNKRSNNVRIGLKKPFGLKSTEVSLKKHRKSS